jgi:hypothetical protein
MKLTPTVIIIFIAFALIIIVSITKGSNKFTPYSFHSSTLKGHPYEGFSGLEYTTYPNNTSVDSYKSKEIQESPVVPGDKRRVLGFDGLLVSSEFDDKSIDIYSQAKGDNKCQSYGYMNSMGYLCMDKNQLSLLTSRGGNASFGGDTIGQ